MKKNNYQKVAKDVIQKEIDGLKKLKLHIGRSFDQIIRTIMNCKNGKIIVVGSRGDVNVTPRVGQSETLKSESDEYLI